MPQLVSVAAQSSNLFDTLIPTVFDSRNIQNAFIYYHYGIDEVGEEPTSTSISGHLKKIKNNLSLIEESLSLSASNAFSASSSIIEANTYGNEIINKNIEERINNIRKNIYLYFNNQSENYSLELSDHNKMIIFNSSLPLTLLIPDDEEVDFAIGSTIKIMNIGNSSVEILPKNTASIRGEEKTMSQNESKIIYKRSQNDWVVIQ